jgi:ubiquinone/menaquinone biosynthesis C-methylase UbiE
MKARFVNCYEDTVRAEAYARLAFAGTYALAYRDLPALLAEHVPGRRALDFGCGTGRSTRFLSELGFAATGVDISEEMLRLARQADPDGDYRLVPGDDLSGFGARSFDLVLAAFTFDNVPDHENRITLLAALERLLVPDGGLVLVASRPEIYTHEWVSFSTRDFPENRDAGSGDTVRIIVTDHGDNRPVEDVLWPDASYRDAFERASLRVVASHIPLARGDEPWPWVNETAIGPWVIYVAKPASGEAPTG